MRVRLEDVARVAGVSPKTVSRVLNDEPNVRQSTRDRVRQAMEKLNYRPHIWARSLASNQSYTVAILHDNPSPSYLTEIENGVLEACDRHGYSMLVRPLSIDARDFVKSVQTMISVQKPDGLVLTPPVSDDVELLECLHEHDVCFASVSPKLREGAIGVFMDEQQAAREIVYKLIDMGHRRIAHVIGHPKHGASGWRMSGYLEALSTRGIAVEESLVFQGDFSFESGVRAAHRMFALAEQPTAIFAGNDDMASGVLWAAAEHGLVVPRDLSVCGFDDTPISRQVWPTLTTVHQPVRAMGRIASQQLLDRLRGRGEGCMVQVPFRLEIRDSMGPVR